MDHINFTQIVADNNGDIYGLDGQGCVWYRKSLVVTDPERANINYTQYLWIRMSMRVHPDNVKVR